MAQASTQQSSQKQSDKKDFTVVAGKNDKSQMQESQQRNQNPSSMKDRPSQADAQQSAKRSWEQPVADDDEEGDDDDHSQNASSSEEHFQKQPSQH